MAEVQPHWAEQATKQEGVLLGLLTAAGYAFFTLLPDSHSLMVAWPWVLLWQAVLGVPLLWFLQVLAYQRRVQPLGNGLDGVVLLLLAGLAISGTVSAFPNQARWYGWALLGGLAVIYPLGAWLRSPERRWQLVQAQGYLTAAFVVVSLGVWLGTTLVPEWLRQATLSTQGLSLQINTDALELRNWAPFGHQNYVAGYLLLALPLVGVLALQAEPQSRWWRSRPFWLGVLLLGLVDLYTTFSRGGGLGLMAMAIALFIGLIWQQRQASRRWLQMGGLTIIGLLVIALANDRLRRSLVALSQGGQGAELAYRWITSIVGWRMGAAQPLTGNGLGSVPLWYQHYRPAWAGREAEWIYQLHSTPVQLWAELGIWGIGAFVLGIVLLTYWAVRYRRWWPQLSVHEQRLALAIYLALLGYSVLSLTDFQLDNIGIGGLLLLELTLLATLLRTGQHQNPPSRLRPRWALLLVASGLGVMMAMIAWLTPIHRAWWAASDGFLALLEEPPQWNRFTEKLFQAQELAPWQPYYPLQLGWNYGQRGIGTETVEAQSALLRTAIAEFEKGIERSPYLEFGYSNVGWLYWREGKFAQAATAFAQAAQLVPAKRGNFLGLGLALIASNQPELATEALTLEVLRHPLFITSPAWRSAPLAPFYPSVLQAVSRRYAQLETELPPTSAAAEYVRQIATVLQWWQGNLAAAKDRLSALPPSAFRDLLEPLLTISEFPSTPHEAPHPPNVGQLFLRAWYDERNRLLLLETAWRYGAGTTINTEQLQQIVRSLRGQSNPLDWLRSAAPAVGVSYRRAGFGVNSRIVDGPQPTDFFIAIDNLPMVTLFQALWPDNVFLPQLDQALEGDRHHLLNALKAQERHRVP
ncbi:O-antigen ligase family protein [Parathermosynechococcus lividus]